MAGFQIRHDVIFDTVCVDGVDAEKIQAAAIDRGINIRVVDESTVAMTFDETTDHRTLSDVVESFGVEPRDLHPLDPPAFGDDLARSGDLMPQEVFHRYHSEHEMLRYLRRLSDKILRLIAQSPLGSCDEIEYHHRDGTDFLVTVWKYPSVCPRGAARGLPTVS